MFSNVLAISSRKITLQKEISQPHLWPRAMMLSSEWDPISVLDSTVLDWLPLKLSIHKHYCSSSKSSILPWQIENQSWMSKEMRFWRFLDCGCINLMLKNAKDGRADQLLYLFLSISRPSLCCMTHRKQFCRVSSFWRLCALLGSFTFSENQLQLLPGSKWSYWEYQKMTSHTLRYLMSQLHQWLTWTGALIYLLHLTCLGANYIHLLLDAPAPVHKLQNTVGVVCYHVTLEK